MHQSSAKLLQEYLNRHGYSPQEFAYISGMPLTEVIGILEGRLAITKLRANHLAAAFNTNPKMWMDKTASKVLASEQ